MDESQIRAATYPADAALILQAGAGSGKTQTMAARIAYLLQSGVPGHSILGICFTRQAAETLRGRVRSTLPPTLTREAHALKLKTFHAFGLECLRRFGALQADTHVLDARQQHQLARRVVDTYAQREKSSEAVTDLVDYVNRVKTMRMPPIPQLDPALQDAYLFPYYQKALHEEHNAVDFGDLQQMFYDLIRPVPATALTASQGCGGGLDEQQPSQGEHQPPQQQQQGGMVPSDVCTALRAEYTHFVVDEFQDFNEIQVELLALLAGDACHVTCVGDPNQCIYTWRGAMPNVFGVWKKRFPQTAMLTLAVNYRSDGPIVEAANRVVKATQMAHHHREERAVTLVQCASEDDELQAVPLVIEHVLRRRDAHLGYGDIAILCRSRRRVQLYCDVLQSQRIPVRQLRGMSVDHLASMRSLLAFLRLCVSPHGPEGDANVRTVLNTAPLHRLSPGAAKKFLLSLDSVCQARRATEAARIRSWRHTIHVDNSSEVGADNGGAQGSRSEGLQPGAARTSVIGGGCPTATTPGVHPESHSFFAVLQELVYHNFSHALFPKLEVSKKNQKNIRSVVRIVVHAKELLAQPSCDVEQVLRYVLREGGYEGESMAAVAARTVTPSATTRGTKRARNSAEGWGSDRCVDEASGRSSASAYQPRVGALLMERCASQHNQQQQRYTSSSAPASCSSAGGGDSRWDRWHHGSRRSGAASGSDGAGDEDVLPPEEEAAVWQEQRMNLSELVLHTYHSVQEALEREVTHELDKEGGGGEGRGEEASSRSRPSQASGNHSNSRSRLFSKATAADDSVSNFSAGSTTTTMTVMQALRPPAVVLHRVLDEFVSLVSSDDYGPMREIGNADDAAGAAAGADTAGNGGRLPTSTSPHWIGEVTVGTVHRAKGMEWPAVLLPGCWVGEYPVRPRDEEKRVFYVGMSRAMKHLVCFTAAAREGRPGSGQAVTAASVVDLPAQHSQSGTLEPTPYLAALGDTLERVNYADLKTAYLTEQGYL
ncbi:putative ATP-dependent DNA helicase [Leishmania major strain Friedlin]|uniref:DNA 3'-5' helicase n=1 Tax=Leishmania major TaxID=5664 RepID=Q4QHW5_LEIMA|nr:putative ATP-dependent DNA helicase [Leishmania major strain Friedlin]CAG9569674.1 ATP-dependent_DNA_helicase_-__putative [Leishmania major strain Friedlin]CAJ02587.1 putative ATP-dependent DNA helicase [Leishmania major strain Friedlin]|eukprot:XP_001681233.1 putative ATP-dependent DNA helicase [Leishmania major strain Friedlin]